MPLLLSPVVLMLTLNLQAEPASQPADKRPPIATGFLYYTTTLDGETYAYNVFVPPTYDPEQEWPVVLFLHGSGERGSDGFLQTDVGLPHCIRQRPDRWPAVVVMPQCRANKNWWDADMGNMALKCLEETSRKYRLDSQRVYLTGLSLGGAGTWFLATNLPGRFAAIAPVCGFWKPEDASKLTGVPIWAFHGEKDDRVPAAASRDMVAAIKAAGGDVRYTEYPGQGHMIWDRVYGDRAFVDWLFAQRLGRPATPATGPATGDADAEK